MTPLRLLLGALALGLSILAPPAFSQTKPPADPFTWSLGRFTVLSAGTTRTGPEGTFIEGYRIEAQATSRTARAPIPAGTWVLTLSAFQPSRDLPGQKAGVWYLQGDWTLTRAGAATASSKARHSSDVMKGLLSGALPFNPVGSAQPWTAVARSPKSILAGQWLRGEGSLTVNAAGGDLYLALGR